MIKTFLTVLLLLFVNIALASKAPRVVPINSGRMQVFAHQGDELKFISADGKSHNLELYNNGVQSFKLNVEANKATNLKVELLGEFQVIDAESGNNIGLVSVKLPGSRKKVDSANGEWFDYDVKEHNAKFSDQNLVNQLNKPKADAAKPSDAVKQDTNNKPKADAAKPSDAAKQDANAKPKVDDAKQSANTKPKTDTIDETDAKAKQEGTQAADKAKESKDKAKESTNEGNTGSMLTINAVILGASLLSALLI